MPRPGDAVWFRPEHPSQLTFLRGIFVTFEDDCLVLAVPAAAAPSAGRYNVPGQNGGSLAVTYISVGADALLEEAACPPEETMSFSSPPDLNDLLRVYFVQQSGTESAVTASSRRQGEAMPSSRTPGLPTSVANPELQMLTKLVEKLALNVDDQARALAEALGRRGQPPSAQTAGKATRFAAAPAARPSMNRAGSAGPTRMTWDQVWEPRAAGLLGSSDEDWEEEPSGTGGGGRSASAAAASSPQYDLKGLAGLIKAIRGKKGSSSGSSDEATGGDKKQATQLKGIQKLRDKIREKPEDIIRDYIKMVRLKLGASHSAQVWTIHDYSKRLLPRFGRHRGMYRIHHMLGQCIQALAVEKDYPRGTAMCIQLHKAIHQSVLDNNSWENAALIWGGIDPLQTDEFAGDPQELSYVYAYRKALNDLKSRHRPGGGEGGEEEEEAQADPKGKGRRRRKVEGADGGAGK